MTTALVTGGNRGIGREIVRALRSLGMTVLLGARDRDRGERAAAETGAEWVRLDVTDQETIAHAAQRLDGLDVLVNNAALMGLAGQTPGAADRAALREVFETNVLGVVAVTDAMLPLLRRSPRGRIVNMSSSVGALADMLTSPIPPALGYPTSKTALNAVTVQYAKALADTPIKVNAACPGYCDGAQRTAAEGARIAVELATLPADGPTGGFFDDGGRVPW